MDHPSLSSYTSVFFLYLSSSLTTYIKGILQRWEKLSIRLLLSPWWSELQFTKRWRLTMYQDTEPANDVASLRNVLNIFYGTIIMRYIYIYIYTFQTLSVEYIHNKKGRKYLIDMMERQGYYVYSLVTHPDNLANDIIFVKRNTWRVNTNRQKLCMKNNNYLIILIMSNFLIDISKII